jgi:integrase
MQEIRRFRPSAVSRRLSVVAGFYRTCVIDGVLEQSPGSTFADRSPARAANTRAKTFAVRGRLHVARESTNPNDFALVVMLGLLGLRIFEATGASIDDLGEERGHRVLRARSKGDKVVLVPLPPAVTVGEKRGWRLGRIIDPFGLEWDIGTPLGGWPPR